MTFFFSFFPSGFTSFAQFQSLRCWHDIYSITIWRNDWQCSGEGNARAQSVQCWGCSVFIWHRFCIFARCLDTNRKLYVRSTLLCHRKFLNTWFLYVIKHEIFPFASQYPLQTYGYAFLFSLSGYLGIQFVLTLVRTCGAPLAATVTTARKAVTIIISFIFFAKPFSIQ